jgi:hypothetical protein
MITLFSDRNDWKKSAISSLPGDFTYACRYWTEHVVSSKLNQPLVDLLHKFTSDHLLDWIELLIRIDALELGTSGLSSASKALSVSFRVPFCEVKIYISTF